MKNEPILSNMLENLGFNKGPDYAISLEKIGYGVLRKKHCNITIFKKGFVQIEQFINSGYWRYIYQGKVNPYLIRSILEENGLVEKQETSLTELSESLSTFESLIGRPEGDVPEFYRAAEVVFDAAKAHLVERYDNLYGIEVNQENTFCQDLADLMERHEVVLSTFVSVFCGQFCYLNFHFKKIEGIELKHNVLEMRIEEETMTITAEMVRAKE